MSSARSILACGAPHWSLTDTDRDYNLGAAGFPQHPPSPFQPTVLHFAPKGPIQSPFKQTLQEAYKNQDYGILSPSCGLFTTRPSIDAYIYA
jgi:hypothetical protein